MTNDVAKPRQYEAIRVIICGIRVEVQRNWSWESAIHHPPQLKVLWKHSNGRIAGLWAVLTRKEVFYLIKNEAITQYGLSNCNYFNRNQNVFFLNFGNFQFLHFRKKVSPFNIIFCTIFDLTFLKFRPKTSIILLNIKLKV